MDGWIDGCDDEKKIRKIERFCFFAELKKKFIL